MCTWKLKWRANVRYNRGKRYKFFPASSEHSSDHGGCFVYIACSLVIRPSLGSNWKLLWQILAKKYTSLSTSSEINHARLTTVTAGIILWSRTTVRRNNSSLVSVLSLHRAGRSNLVERILPFFFSFHFVILPFAEAIDGSIKILSACNGQARADPKRQSTRLSWEKVLPR